jgi:hypothetical protein
MDREILVEDRWSWLAYLISAALVAWLAWLIAG